MKRTAATIAALALSTSALLIGAAAPASAAPVGAPSISNSKWHPGYKQYVQSLSAKQLLAGVANPTDTKRYGQCKVVSRELACASKAGKGDAYVMLTGELELAVPAAVLRAAKPGSLHMEAIAHYHLAKGSFNWGYNDEANATEYYPDERVNAKGETSAPELAMLPLTPSVWDGAYNPELHFELARGGAITIKSLRVNWLFQPR